jgi:hypothetical protein
MKINIINKIILGAVTILFGVSSAHADGHSYTVDSSNMSQYADMLTEVKRRCLMRMIHTQSMFLRVRHAQFQLM